MAQLSLKPPLSEPTTSVCNHCALGKGTLNYRHLRLQTVQRLKSCPHPLLQMTEGSVVVLESQNSYYLSKAFTTNHNVSLNAVFVFFVCLLVFYKMDSP